MEWWHWQASRSFRFRMSVGCWVSRKCDRIRALWQAARRSKQRSIVAFIGACCACERPRRLRPKTAKSPWRLRCDSIFSVYSSVYLLTLVSSLAVFTGFVRAHWSGTERCDAAQSIADTILRCTVLSRALNALAHKLLALPVACVRELLRAVCLLIMHVVAHINKRVWAPNMPCLFASQTVW